MSAFLGDILSDKKPETIALRASLSHSAYKFHGSRALVILCSFFLIHKKFSGFLRPTNSKNGVHKLFSEIKNAKWLHSLFSGFRDPFKQQFLCSWLEFQVRVVMLLLLIRFSRSNENENVNCYLIKFALTTKILEAHMPMSKISKEFTLDKGKKPLSSDLLCAHRMVFMGRSEPRNVHTRSPG